MNPYPVESCLFPPLKSTVINKCKDKCKSTVTVIHDMSSDMFGRYDLIDMLSNDHEVLVFNNRGHFNISYENGNVQREEDDGTLKITSYIPDPSRCKEEHDIDAYSIDLFVEDTRRILDKHGIEKTDLVGFSLGSFVAQAFAAKYPERTRKVAIGKSFTQYHDLLVKAKNLMTGTPFKTGYWFWCNSRPKFNSEREYGCNVPMAIADEIGKTILNIDTTKDQLEIKAPAMVINCSDDLILGLPVDKIKGMKDVRMDRCGHVFNAKNEEMYKKIVDYLNE